MAQHYVDDQTLKEWCVINGISYVNALVRVKESVCSVKKLKPLYMPLRVTEYAMRYQIAYEMSRSPSERQHIKRNFYEDHLNFMKPYSEKKLDVQWEKLVFSRVKTDYLPFSGKYLINFEGIVRKVNKDGSTRVLTNSGHSAIVRINGKRIPVYKILGKLFHADSNLNKNQNNSNLRRFKNAKDYRNCA